MWWRTSYHSSLGSETTGIYLVKAYKRRVEQVCSKMKGSVMYLADGGRAGTTSSLAAKKTNLVPSYSLTHAKGGMESLALSQFLSKLHSPNPHSK